MRFFCKMNLYHDNLSHMADLNPTMLVATSIEVVNICMVAVEDNLQLQWCFWMEWERCLLAKLINREGSDEYHPEVSRRSISVVSVVEEVFLKVYYFKVLELLVKLNISSFIPILKISVFPCGDSNMSILIPETSNTFTSDRDASFRFLDKLYKFSWNLIKLLILVKNF